MNKYVTQLLEVIQKKTGCDTSGAVRWLAEQAGVSERTAWNWKTAGKVEEGNGKEPRQNCRGIEEVNRVPCFILLNAAGHPVPCWTRGFRKRLHG